MRCARAVTTFACCCRGTRTSPRRGRCVTAVEGPADGPLPCSARSSRSSWPQRLRARQRGRARASSCSSSASSRRTRSTRATRATPAASCTSPRRPSRSSAATAGAPTSSIATTGIRRSAPVLQRLEPRSPAPSVLTLHNVGYQGVFADDVLRGAGLRRRRASAAGRRAQRRRHELPARRAARGRSRHDGEPHLRRARSACRSSAWGSRTCSTARGADLVGILNGVDYGVWSPDRDPFLATALRRDQPDAETPHQEPLLERLRLAAGSRRTAARRREPARRAERHRSRCRARCRRCCRDTRASFVLLGNGDAPSRRRCARSPTRTRAACRSSKATTSSSRTRSSPAPT